MEQKKIERIAELSRKHKAEGLSPEETEERRALHREYVEDYRRNLAAMLDNTYIQKPDGTREKLQRKDLSSDAVGKSDEKSDGKKE